jgi:hypothetical protein
VNDEDVRTPREMFRIVPSREFDPRGSDRHLAMRAGWIGIATVTN